MPPGYRALILNILLQAKRDLELTPNRRGEYSLSHREVLLREDALWFLERNGSRLYVSL